MIAGRMTTPIIRVLKSAIGLTEEPARKEDKKNKIDVFRKVKKIHKKA
jgi:hypothetical protein